MNEQTLNVLENYDFKVYKTVRGRGGFICTTSEGVKFLGECTKPESYYLREREITENIDTRGEFLVDKYVCNVDNEPLTELEGIKYYVKNWVDGRECDIESVQEIRECVQLMAKLHIQLNKMAEKSCDANVFLETYRRHTRELKSIWNYLKSKKGKNSFELLLYKNYETFYQEAETFLGLLNELPKFNNVVELRHGNFNYHNVIRSDGGVMIANFDKVTNQYQMQDLYQFIRKILEKNNWSISLGYDIIESYDRCKTIGGQDRKLLGAMFIYPEKFWKIANYYFNSSKAWMPCKNYEKLTKVIEQNVEKQKFIRTFGL